MKKITMLIASMMVTASAFATTPLPIKASEISPIDKIEAERKVAKAQANEAKVEAKVQAEQVKEVTDAQNKIAKARAEGIKEVVKAESKVAKKEAKAQSEAMKEVAKEDAKLIKARAKTNEAKVEAGMKTSTTVTAPATTTVVTK